MKTEKVAYTNEAPWRGHGVKVSAKASTDDILKAAELDFAVEKMPLSFRQEVKDRTLHHEFDGHYALVRRDTNAVLDICGRRYIPTQPRAVIDFFNDFTRKGGATMEMAGSLDGGRVVWAMANLKQDFELPGQDRVRGYLFLGSPNIQGKSLIARLTHKRDVCNNTLQIALRLGKNGYGNVFRMNHRNEFNTIQQERAKEVLGLARDQVKEFEKLAQKLSKTTVTDARAEELFVKLFGRDGEASPRTAILQDVYHHAPGARPGNAWGVLNAVTYYTDHLAGRSSSRRLTQAWTGRNAIKKVEALHALEALVS